MSSNGKEKKKKKGKSGQDGKVRCCALLTVSMKEKGGERRARAFPNINFGIRMRSGEEKRKEGEGGEGRKMAALSARLCLRT